MNHENDCYLHIWHLKGKCWGGDVSVFSSSTCFHRMPSVQITTSSFTWKQEQADRKENALMVIDTFFY